MDEAMIRAGVEALAKLPYGSDPREIVRAVYEAMRLVSSAPRHATERS